MSISIKELGQHLVEDSRVNQEFSAQRRLVDELFPYIYEASKRMSSRAISRWLDANGKKLSAATVAKALRNADSYWQQIADEIEPAARIFANAHDLEVTELLEKPDLFAFKSRQNPTVEGVTHDGVVNSFDEYKGACARLQQEWFALSDTVREACLSSADFGADESERKIEGEGK